MHSYFANQGIVYENIEFLWSEVLALRLARFDNGLTIERAAMPNYDPYVVILRKYFHFGIFAFSFLGKPFIKVVFQRGYSF